MDGPRFGSTWNIICLFTSTYAGCPAEFLQQFVFAPELSSCSLLCLSVSIKLCHSVRISCLQLYIVPYLYHCLFDNVTKSHYLKGMCTLYQQSAVHSQWCLMSSGDALLCVKSNWVRPCVTLNGHDLVKVSNEAPVRNTMSSLPHHPVKQH